MKTLNQIIATVGLGILLVPYGAAAQDLAAFKIPDSARPFIFIRKSQPVTNAAGASAMSVEGTETILAKHFETIRGSGTVEIVLHDALYCRAIRGNGSVGTVGELSLTYPEHTAVLARGRLIKLAEFSERSFAPVRGVDAEVVTPPPAEASNPKR